MKQFFIRKFLASLLMFSLGTGIGYAVTPVTYSASEIDLVQPRKAKKAQKKADSKKKKQKEAIKDGSKAAQKRSYEIQSPEVQDRMKQDKKDIATRDKAKKKSNKTKTKRGAKKYK
jgi:hypothetical protein